MSARSKLRDFYKLKPDEVDAEPEEVDSTIEDHADDLDLPGTLPHEYAKNLLSTAGLAELLATEEAISQEKAALESSQRELVNNNYKKLIQAANTLEYLNGQSALAGLEALATPVQSIADLSKKLWTSDNNGNSV